MIIYYKFNIIFNVIKSFFGLEESVKVAFLNVKMKKRA